MLIDWFTVGAQLVNFIILVVLLKRLFYRPILNAMAAREERIAKALRDAAAKQAAAEAHLNAARIQEQAIQTNRADLLKRAADDADASRAKLIASAKEEVAAMRQRWWDALQHEQERIEHDLVLTLQSELLTLVRTVLRDLAGTQLEDSIARKFAAELHSLSPAEKAPVRSEPDEAAIIRSSFEMPLPTQCELQKVVEEEIGARTVRFETTPDLVCGIELLTRNHKLSWNIQDWLHSFEHSLQDALNNTAAHAHA